MTMPTVGTAVQVVDDGVAAVAVAAVAVAAAAAAAATCAAASGKAVMQSHDRTSPVAQVLAHLLCVFHEA